LLALNILSIFLVDLVALVALVAFEVAIAVLRLLHNSLMDGTFPLLIVLLFFCVLEVVTVPSLPAQLFIHL
jgi:hypothetical protein